MPQTSLDVVIRGRDEFSKTAKGITSSLGSMDSAAEKLGKTLASGFAIGAGIAGFQGFVSAIDRVVHAIPDAIDSGIKFGDTIDAITDVTGASSTAASHFAAQIQYTTGTLDGLSMALRTSTKDIQSNSGELETLGVRTKDAGGHFLDTVTIIENARAVLQKFGQGSVQANQLITLLGRSGLQFADYIALSAAQVALLNTEVDRMGYTIADAAPFEAAKRELTLWDMAWQGLSNSLTVSVLPAIRQVIGSITEAVVTYGPQIKAVLADIVNYISGIVVGLTGLNITPFQTQMAALSSATGGTVLTFEQWALSMGYVIPKIGAATTSTGNLTAAFDRQSAALDRNIARVKALDAASETLYKRTMDSLTRGIDADIAALDAGEKQLDIDRQRKQYAQDIVDARAALMKAARPGADGIVDVEAIRAARRALNDATDAAGEFERTLKVADTRAGLESTKAYVQSIVDLETNATNRKALANTLANRKKVLQDRLATQTAVGDEQGAADTRVRIAAIETAQTRNFDQLRTADKIAGYETEKKKIEEVKAAALAANSAVSTDTADKLAAMRKEYGKYSTEATAKVNDVTGAVTRLNLRLFGDGTGKDAQSPMAKAFTDGKEAAEGLRAKLEEIGAALGSIVGIVDTIISKFTEWGKWEPPQWLQDLAKIVDQLTMHNPASQFFNLTTNPDVNPYAPRPPKTPIPPPAGGFGGQVPSPSGNAHGLVGAAGPMYLPSGGGDTVISVGPFVIDGEVLARVIDIRLARRAGV